MTCPRCQNENPPGSNFCLGCGARFGATCVACDNNLPIGSRFCNKCGTPVGGKSTEQARFASLESYTPKHLAEKILTSRTALEGERKQVTVLFADLKGSMELLADRDPEEARKLLDPVLERMMEAVHRYEGTVNQVMGDGVMALFGAPVAHEDHAVRACYAALRMQESVKRYAEDVRRREGVVIQIRAGLNSGEVVVRSIGGDLRMDYTAVGQTTHLAARMEQLAEPGSILLSPATLELAEGYVTVKPLGPLPVKGLPGPVEVCELVGAGAVRSRLHAAAARGLTRFVGRDGELDQLRQALERAQAGHGQVVSVVGEPGVGKSRLYWEFTHSHRAHGWLIVEASSVSYGKATAYLPVIDLLKAYFQVEGRDDTRRIREKVTGKVLSLDRALESLLSALLSLLEVPVEDEAWERLDPPQRRQRTLDAVKRLLLRESQVQPLLLLFEDLHWIDAETQALLDGLVESLPTARLLLLANYRPEYQHKWNSKTYYRQLRIDPLPAESADDLLTSVLGAETSLDALKRMLIERTEGNPLFLEESVRALAETKALIGERGAYRLAHDATAIQVPATVQAILAARIDRLAPEDKRLLQAAAVIGKDVPFVLLLAIAERTEEDLRQGLAHLQAAEFLYETSLFPDPEYTFKHALTHEVTYGTLLQDRRRMLHARIAGAIERCYPDRLTEHVERLAHHAVRGEMWDPAVAYLHQAGAKALARSANREAVSYFEQALTALQHLPETRARREQAIDLRFDLRTALFPLGEFERIFGCLREAQGLARALDDQRRLGQLSVYMCHNLNMTGRPTEALEFGQRAHAIGESLGDVPLQVTGNLYLGGACLRTGDYRRAEELLLKVLQLLDGNRGRERLGLAGFPAVMARFYLDCVLADQGKFAEAIIHGQDGIRLAEALDHPYSLTVMCSALGYVHIAQGELNHAIRLLERGVALGREWNLTFHWAQNAGILGYAYALAGRSAEGISLLEHALSALETIGVGAYQPSFLVYLGEAYVLADRLEDAREPTNRALTLARESNQRGYEARALQLLGEISARCDLPEHAHDHYREALALAVELGMRPLVAHCHLGLAKLSARPDKRQEEQQHLSAAMAMYRDMSMTYWLEKAQIAKTSS
jgi:class 3 adenylate cyclase/tetratricopeptide (TPR) repeat protein